MNTETPTFQMSSLYVGDLHPDINEASLFEKFSAAGPILSIRICRDVNTRRSLGYAYVNFQLPADAERALDTMNFDTIRGQPIRMMWSQRDPSMRRSGVGNVFIKDLQKDIDTKAIYDTFSAFGNIVSCKVATDDKGNSKGYGFIHFETEEAANTAIEKVNQKLLNGKKVYVGKFIPRQEREKDMGVKKTVFTNVYVKNLEDEIDDEKLKALFEPYGTITSYKVMFKEDGKSKGFGFVAFETTEAAQAAVEALNGKPGKDNKPLFVTRAQVKAERQQELKRKFDELKKQRQEAIQGVNLYVKNIDDTFDDERLRKEFLTYGTITSAKVMTDDQGRSKGFGFVCFSSPNEATCAVTELNGRVIGGKRLYVALAQRKEDRKANLASQFSSQYLSGGIRMQQQLGQVYPPNAAGGFFVPNMPPGPRFFGGPPVTKLVRGTQSWVPPQVRSGGPEQGAIRPGSRFQNGSGRTQAQPGYTAAAIPMQNGINARLINAQQAGVAAPNMQMANGGGAPTTAGPSTPQYVASFNGNVRNLPVQQQQQQIQQQQIQQSQQQQAQQQIQQQQQQFQVPPPPVQQKGQENLLASRLLNAKPQEQKQILGECLYPLIARMNGGLAGKITGMLLEIDNSELLHMVEDHDALRAKVEEAVAVLHVRRIAEPAKPVNH